MPWRPLTIVVARLMVSLSLAVPTSRLSVALRTMRLPRSTSCTAGAEALAVAPPLDGASAAGAAAPVPPPAAAPPAALSPPALHPAASSVASANASAAAARLLFISTPSSTRSASIGRWSRPVRFPGAHRRTAAAAPGTAHLRNSDPGEQGIAGDAQAHKDRGPTLSKPLPTPQLQLRDRVRVAVIDRARFDAGWCWPAVAEVAAALLDGVRQGCRREKCLRVWVARALADRRRIVRDSGSPRPGPAGPAPAPLRPRRVAPPGAAPGGRATVPRASARWCGPG